MPQQKYEVPCEHTIAVQVGQEGFPKEKASDVALKEGYDGDVSIGDQSCRFFWYVW